VCSGSLPTTFRHWYVQASHRDMIPGQIFHQASLQQAAGSSFCITTQITVKSDSRAGSCAHQQQRMLGGHCTAERGTALLFQRSGQYGCSLCSHSSQWHWVWVSGGCHSNPPLCQAPQQQPSLCMERNQRVTL